MRYVLARFDQESKDRAYRFYVTDALKGAFGLNARYADIYKPEETRTADEIKNSIKEKLRNLSDD